MDDKKKKKNNLISLDSYRKEKNKQLLKKGHKAASDGNHFSSEVKDSEKEATIYNISDYQKKKLSSWEDKESYQVTTGISEESSAENILKFPKILSQKKNRKSKKTSKKEEEGDIISLPAYKNKKKQERKYTRYVKEASSIAAMAFLMLFIINVVTHTDLLNGNETNRQISSETNLKNKSSWDIQQIRKLKKDKNFIPGKKPNSSKYEGF